MTEPECLGLGGSWGSRAFELAPDERRLFNVRLAGTRLRLGPSWPRVLIGCAGIAMLAVFGVAFVSNGLYWHLALAAGGALMAAGLRTAVYAEPAGLRVRNPFRTHRIPWTSVVAIDVETVRVLGGEGDSNVYVITPGHVVRLAALDRGWRYSDLGGGTRLRVDLLRRYGAVAAAVAIPYMETHDIPSTD